ncbi:MAG: DsrE family protein [Rhodocyclaceae bacterium]|nr:DsrE family protein [Rhodocyclaceae bacterium]MDZ4215356.1 DsrE family protein [Rhodocyclaceae bacterium]
MTATLFILNDPPYGTERSYNGLRLAKALAKQPDQQVRVFLMGDAVACAKAGQKVPEGYYNAGDIVKMVATTGEVGLCGTCLTARGIEDGELVAGATRKTLNDLAAWTATADKVLVF